MAHAPASPTLTTSLGGRAGRPKDHAKHAAIVVAAKHLFARQPFDLVTMEGVAAQAGVSKMTVYSHFHDKETLFETIVGATADQMIAALPAPRDCGPIRDRLVATGTVFLQALLGSEICAMMHTLAATLRANRPLAERFHAAGPGRVRAALAEVIAAEAARGELTVDDPAGAADDLVSLWEGGMPAKLAFGLADPVTHDDIVARAVRGTDVFLRAYRPAADLERDNPARNVRGV